MLKIRKIDKLLYSIHYSKIYNDKGEKIQMLGFGKRKIQYRVIGIELKIKNKNQPASVYIEIQLLPLNLDKFGIKNNVVIINLTLEDMLCIDFNTNIKDMISNFLKLKNIDISEWEREVMDLFRYIEKLLYNKVIELTFKL